MGCGVLDSISGETSADVTERPRWLLLAVRLNRERKVADGLQAKGFEVFLPMYAVRRQWSDRQKTYYAPLFPGYLLCRFALTLTNTTLALSTIGVLPRERVGKLQPIPDSDIELLRRITASQYPVECCDALPQKSEIVEIAGDVTIRGVLVDRGAVCRVAIGFNAMGHTVALRVPLDDLKRVEGPLTPHWSLNAL